MRQPCFIFAGPYSNGWNCLLPSYVSSSRYPQPCSSDYTCKFLCNSWSLSIIIIKENNLLWDLHIQRNINMPWWDKNEVNILGQEVSFWHSRRLSRFTSWFGLLPLWKGDKSDFAIPILQMKKLKPMESKRLTQIFTRSMGCSQDTNFHHLTSFSTWCSKPCQVYISWITAKRTADLPCNFVMQYKSIL